MTPEQLLREGRLSDCLKAVEDQVRKNPADAKQRVSLFQVLCVLGQWDRAITQLEVAAELDPMNQLMAQMGQAAILCERLREEVYAGKRTPMILGEPEPWIAQLVQASALTAQGNHAAADALREQAFESAPSPSGAIDIGRTEGELETHRFEWIADADPRMGPVLEAIVDGKYYWVPFHRIAMLRLEVPTDLRDTVWLPGQMILTAGGQKVVLIPVRYPGSQDARCEPLVRAARQTTWEDSGGYEHPMGQRLFATDAGEFGLLDARAIRFDNAPIVPESTEAPESTGAPES